MSYTPTHSNRGATLSGVTLKLLPALGGAMIAACAAAPPPPTLPTPAAPASLIVEQPPRQLVTRERATAVGAPVFQRGPRGGLFQVEILRGGDNALIAGEDGTVQIVDVATGAVRASTRPWVQRRALSFVEVDPTGTRAILRGGGRPSPRHRVLWDLQSGSFYGTPLEDGLARGSRFSPDGGLVLEIFRDSLKVHDAADLEVRSTMELQGDEDTAPGFAVGVQNRRVAYVDLAGGFHLVDESGRDVGEFSELATGDPGAVILRFRPEGGMLLYAYSDEEGESVVALLHPLTGEVLRAHRFPQVLQSAHFSGGGTHIVVQLGEGSFHIIDASTGELVAHAEGHGEDELFGAHVVHGADGRLSHVLIGGRRSVSPLGAPVEHPFLADDVPGDLVALSEAGHRAAVLEGDELRFVDTASREPMGRLQLGLTPASVWDVQWVEGGLVARSRERSLFFSADDVRALACGAERSWWLDDEDHRGFVSRDGFCALDGPIQPFEDPSVLDSRRPVGNSLKANRVAARTEDGDIEIRRATDLEIVRTIRARDLRFRDCEDCSVRAYFADDGARVAITARDTVRLFELRRGRRVREWRREGYRAGRVALLSGRDDVVIHWNMDPQGGQPPAGRRRDRGDGGLRLRSPRAPRGANA